MASILPDYLADVGREMAAKSASIRRDFATHRLSAGENREDVVATFLRDHLPKRFGVSSGLLFSHSGMFSNQADVVVLDEQNNAPLHSSVRNKLWPVEAVYALIEVKTALGPGEIADAVGKARRFKQMPRRFAFPAPIPDSLSVLWAFDAPSPETVKKNLLSALRDVPRGEQPDLVVVPGQLVVMSGTYLEVARLGQVNSPHRAELHAVHGGNLNLLIPEAAEVYDAGDNALLAWYIWLDSWLRRAGSRVSDPRSYIPAGTSIGRTV